MAGLKIQEMPQSDRPRERLTRLGAPALSDAELIAILFRTGIPGQNALEMASALLAKHGSLQAVARLSVAQLAQVRGLGMAKAAQLAAAFGLASRLAHEKLSAQKIDQPDLVYELLGPEMRALKHEELRVVLLDTRYHLKAIVEVSRGSVNESIAHPREIFLPAVSHSAYAMIVAHNHPSGDPRPSDADTRLTRRLREVSEIMQIPILDHVIIGSPAEGRQPWFSFREAGIL